jgi:hypothetical protein
MRLLSAKFKFLSIIVDTQNSWSVAADIIDNYGIYYANDVVIGDLIYCANNTKYVITEVSVTSGARFIGKIAWHSEDIVQSPTIDLIAVIGAINNGEFILPNQAAQSVHIDFTNQYIYSSMFTEHFFTKTCVISNSFKLGSLKVYLNGIRLSLEDDYSINGSTIVVNDYEIDDIVVVDYERL